MLPISIEEKLICYADKFFSKSGDYHQEKPFDKVLQSMSRHGADTLSRFLTFDNPLDNITYEFPES